MDNIIKNFESAKGHKVTTKYEGGQVYLNIDEVAIGLGLFREKNGKDYIMWDRVNKYIEESRDKLGDLVPPTKVGKGDFITEQLFYMLAMKSSNEVAKIFQAWICVDVLPSIRANGMYLSDNMTTDQLKRAESYFNEKKLKRLLLTCEDERVEEEYKLGRAIQSNKVEYDERVIKVLKKRPLGAETNKLLLKLVDKQTKRAIKMANKYKTRLQEIEPLDEDYTEIRAHGFSINYQYETLEGDKKKKSNAYRTWWDNFPHDQLPSIEGIDFNKGVDVWLRFINFRAKKHDATNFHKSIIDKLCDYYQVDDINVNIRECRSVGECSSYEDGKIYICVRQALDK